MSFFPRLTQEFTPFFQIINDYDRVARSAARGCGPAARGCSPSVSTFQPRFDVKELKDSYELNGELPGIDQKNVSIEWSNGNTLSITGSTETHTETSTSSTTPAADASVAESSDAADVSDTASEASYVKPSVSDENEDGESSTIAGDALNLTPATTNVAEVTKPTEPAAPAAKYWISERSSGSFRRSFSFPVRVDQESVKASLKNGVLNIVVPKAKIPEPRKINID